jgi:DNA-binding transcriptional MerR regulator
MRIGDLSAHTYVSVRSLRYYEEHGLLTAHRTASGQRTYGSEAVERVLLLRRLYRAGLNSATIAALLPCVDTPSEEVTSATIELMRHEHARISEQITQLITTRDDLSSLIDAAAAYHRDEQVPTGPGVSMVSS